MVYSKFYFILFCKNLFIKSKDSIIQIKYYTIRDNQLKFEWVFNSLRAIMETILLLNEPNNRNEVKLCKFCK